MAPVRSYTNWNSRTTDEEEQIEPYRKYFFICEGANTETWYEDADIFLDYLSDQSKSMSVLYRTQIS